MQNECENPLVSVVIPIHNAEQFVAESIESILSQTYQNFELLLINDGSTDNTAYILEKYALGDKRIRILTNSKAMGYGGERASNEAYKLAKGKYIAKLDADDIALPERLSKQVDFMEHNPDIFLVGSWLTIIDETGQETGKRQYPTTSTEILRTFYYRSCIGHPSIMFRNYILKNDFYKIKFDALNDYYSFFEHLQSGLQVANLPEYLIKYRVHSNNTVFSSLRRQWAVNMKIKRSFIQEWGYEPPWQHKVYIFLLDLTIKYLPLALINQLVHLRAKLKL